jgi:hypothetical protein
MALFAFHDLTLETKHQGDVAGEDLARVLEELSWVSITETTKEPTLRLSVSDRQDGLTVPPLSKEVFRADGFSALESGDDFYVTDGFSILRLRPAQGEGSAFLAPSFWTKPALLQSNFWAFTLLKLLRPLGLHSLHSAGVVAKEKLGVLIIGPPGSGKSTLALGLIRHGWRYLSDDAVLLRFHAVEVEALALRKHFYIDASAAGSVVELPLGEEVPDNTGRLRRRVCLEETCAERYAVGCFPQVLLFSRIVPQAQSSLLPLDQVHALRHLLSASGPQLLDRKWMNPHLEVLKRLIQQTASYELQAGLDLYRNPITLVHLLNEAEGAEKWPG